MLLFLHILVAMFMYVVWFIRKDIAYSRLMQLIKVARYVSIQMASRTLNEK